MTDGSGGAIVLPTTSTVPTLPAIPIETLPTVPDLTAPSVPLPTVPNLPVDPTSPTVSTGPGSGSSTSPGSGTSPASTTSSPATTTSTMPADCPPRSPTQTTDPPEESSLPPSDSSIPSSEPEQQPTTQPPEATTPIDACPPGFDDPALHPLPSEIVDDELGTVALLAGIEVVAVNAYTMVLGAATAGSLGAVPPAVAHYGATALDHHRVALDAWNRVLMAVGRPAVTQPPATLAITIDEQLGAITDGAALLDVAFIMERIAAATYLDALHKLASEPAIRLAGSILSVDRQRMAVLLFADGQYPVPETFASTEFAYVPQPA